jgi:hypothetical protein
VSGFDNGTLWGGVFFQAKQFGSILRGTGAPMPQAGIVGDLYIDTQSWQLYAKRSTRGKNPWRDPLFTVPATYRTGLKWFSPCTPSNTVGVDGDYFLLWAGFDDYGTQPPTIIGPKIAGKWPGSVPPFPVGEFFFALNLSGLEDNAGPASQTEMAYWVPRGVNIFRLPINLNQLQPTIFGPIDPTYFALISAAMANAAAVGARLIPDFHNFGFAPNGQKFGTPTAPITALSDAWLKFAAALRADPNYSTIFAYDLMNEWSNMDPNAPGLSTAYSQNLILSANLAVYHALRDAGDSTTIFFEWDNFSSAWSAVQNNIQILFAAMVGLTNVVASLHNYLDTDASGTHYVASQVFGQPSISPPGITVTVNIGVQRLTAAVALAQQYGVILNIGESGWSTDPEALGGVNNYAIWNQAGFNLVDFCRQNKVSFIYWAAGPGFATAYGTTVQYAYNPTPVSSADPNAKDWSSAGVQAAQVVTINKFTGYAGPQPTAYLAQLPFGVVPYSPSGTPFSGLYNYYGGIVSAAVHFTGHATLSDGTDAGGTFGSISFAPGENGLATFPYTPAISASAIRLTFTNDAGLTNPPAIGISSLADFFNTSIGSIAPNVYAPRLLNTSYVGPAIRLQRVLDGAQMDFYFNNRGDLPRQAIQDWASSRTIQLVTLYNQFGGNDLIFNSTNINLVLVDATGYPSILISGPVRAQAGTPSVGQGLMTVYAEINPANGGDIITQDLFNPNFRLTSGGFYVANNGTPTYPVTIGATLNTWSDIAATYSSLYASNNLNAYIAGSLVHQATAAQFVNAAAFNACDFFNFRFGDQHYAGSVRALVIQYLEYSAGQLATLHGQYNTYYTTPLPDPLAGLPPTISNVANSKIFTGTSSPFFQTIIGDGNAGATDSVSITLSGASATLTGTGLSGSNPYTLASDTPANITTKLQALILHSAASVGSVINVAFTVTSSAGGSSPASFAVTVANYGLETPYAAPVGAFTPPNKKGCVMDGGENQPSPNYPHHFLTDYYAGKTFGLARMPIADYYLTTGATGQQPLNIPYITANIKPQIDYFRAKNMWVILDLHRFGFVNGIVPNSSVLCTPQLSANDCLIDFWSRLASLLKNSDNVMLELQNEPLSLVADWAALVPKLCTAIRNAGFTGPILIEGGQNFSGAWTWTSSGNAAAFAGFAGDPGNNFYFAPHQYLDFDGSGQHPEAVPGFGATALDYPTQGLFTTWARAHGFKAIMTEGGFAPATWQPTPGNPMTWSDAAAPEATNGITEGSAMWSFMTANNDVFAGWTFFASNNFPTGTPTDHAGKYAFILDPPYFGGSTFYTPVVDQPQMAVLTANL